jgi:uncharacterized damage-inducible protein DinB
MSEISDPNQLLALYHYNAYAHQLVLGVVDQLTDDEFTRQSSPSHGSVRQLLTHMLECEAFFLAQCTGQPIALDEANLSTPENIRRYWEQLGQAQREFIGSQNQAGLSQIIPWQIRGQQLAFPAWQLLMQAVVHSIHHRGELSILLTEMGHPLPTLDIILHFVEQSGQTWPSA